MLRAARRGRSSLPDAARVAAFLAGSWLPDGGFPDRSGKSDLYYTVFGLQCLSALDADLPAATVRRYLDAVGDGPSLDLVHLGCLLRCWSTLPPPTPAGLVPSILARVESHRSADGGYHVVPGAMTGSAYACFLALAAYQDAGAELPDRAGMVRCLHGLDTPDGAFSGDLGIVGGVTPVTAAAVAVLAELGEPVPQESVACLLSRSTAEGGFLAAQGAPMPDLLSTATALHALAMAGAAFDNIRPACRTFVEGLWSDHGGFRGHTGDETLDAEYTFYGLLALGHVGG